MAVKVELVSAKLKHIEESLQVLQRMERALLYEMTSEELQFIKNKFDISSCDITDARMVIGEYHGKLLSKFNNCELPDWEE